MKAVISTHKVHKLGYIKYILAEYKEGLIFQMVDQSPSAKSFLDVHGFKGITMPNGWTVAIHKKPEIDIENKIIYLRGSSVSKDSKIDKLINFPQAGIKSIIKEVNYALIMFDEYVRQHKNSGSAVLVGRDIYENIYMTANGPRKPGCVSQTPDFLTKNHFVQTQTTYLYN